MQNRIRTVLLQLLMQPKWVSRVGFGFDDWGAVRKAEVGGLVEWYTDDEQYRQARVTDKGKEFLNGTD